MVRTRPISARNLQGYAYAGREDFVAYLLGINGDIDRSCGERPVYVIYGTPTPDPLEKFTDDNVVIREYELTRDPISDAPVPFFRDDAYGVVNEIYDER